MSREEMDELLKGEPSMHGEIQKAGVLPLPLWCGLCTCLRAPAMVEAYVLWKPVPPQFPC